MTFKERTESLRFLSITAVITATLLALCSFVEQLPDWLQMIFAGMSIAGCFTAMLCSYLDWDLKRGNHDDN